MRIVSWNIRAGGGRRVELIAGQLRRWTPDLVVLCEFRATEPSRRLAGSLAAFGLAYQQTTADPDLPQANRLLVASRWPLRRLRLAAEPSHPGRWLAVTVEAPLPFVVGTMHIPIVASGYKHAFLEAIEALTRRWRRGPALLVGDTNSGRPSIDEESPVFGPRTEAWFRTLHRRGWVDAFRHVHGDARVYTWYSPNRGNGFRLDQAFVNRLLLPRLRDARYVWGQPCTGAARRDALSDHAALLLDLDAPCDGMGGWQAARIDGAMA
jgi:exodeoxyribonuclease-3